MPAALARTAGGAAPGKPNHHRARHLDSVPAGPQHHMPREPPAALAPWGRPGVKYLINSLFSTVYLEAWFSWTLTLGSSVLFWILLHGAPAFSWPQQPAFSSPRSGEDGGRVLMTSKSPRPPRRSETRTQVRQSQPSSLSQASWMAWRCHRPPANAGAPQRLHRLAVWTGPAGELF